MKSMVLNYNQSDWIFWFLFTSDQVSWERRWRRLRRRVSAQRAKHKVWVLIEWYNKSKWPKINL